MDPCSNISLNKPESHQLTIVLENPLKTYFAGEMVKGLVKFQAKENQIVQVLSVYLRGEFHYKKGENEHVERIFIESSPVDYRGAGEGNIEMEFSLVLRPNSPTSMETPVGGIRYRIFSNLVFKEDDQLQSLEDSELISVNCPKKLPQDYSGRQASSIERAGLLCCIGSISAEMDVSRVYLLCGRPALVSGCVFNGTHSSVQSTAIHLEQTVERQRDRKKMKRNAASKQRGAILPGKRQVWLSESFLIPPLPPTSDDTFFKTSYKFVMEIQKVSGKSVKLKIPVVIGNMPPTVDIVPTHSLGALHNDNSSQIECKCSDFPDEIDGFKPLYVTYNL